MTVFYSKWKYEKLADVAGTAEGEGLVGLAVAHSVFAWSDYYYEITLNGWLSSPYLLAYILKWSPRFLRRSHSSDYTERCHFTL